MRRGIFGGALALLLLLAPLALAAEPTERQAFAEQAEPICKSNVLANKQIFKGVEGMIKKGELRKASKRFSRAASAFNRTIERLDAIPKPPADATKLGKWIAGLKEVKGVIKKIGQALAAGNKRKAESFSVELNRLSNKANNAALGFEFDYCRVDSSRFR